MMRTAIALLLLAACAPAKLADYRESRNVIDCTASADHPNRKGCNPMALPPSSFPDPYDHYEHIASWLVPALTALGATVAAARIAAWVQRRKDVSAQVVVEEGLASDENKDFRKALLARVAKLEKDNSDAAHECELRLLTQAAEHALDRQKWLERESVRDAVIAKLTMQIEILRSKLGIPSPEWLAIERTIDEAADSAPKPAPRARKVAR